MHKVTDGSAILLGPAGLPSPVREQTIRLARMHATDQGQAAVRVRLTLDNLNF